MATVSVIIPTYNRADLLPDSIGSVLAQDYKDIEVVVVDDGSSDNTREVVCAYGPPVRYCRQENAGESAARNLGILSSVGDYLMFLDSDDKLLPGAVAKLAATLDANPEYGAAYCGFTETDESGKTCFESPLDKPSGDVFAKMCTEYLCIVHSVMTRRECLARSGLFDTLLTNYVDMDFNTRIAAHCKFVFVQEHLAEYRVAYSIASKVTPGRERQQHIYMTKMTQWHMLGRLTDDQLQQVRRLIYGPTPGEHHMHLAYDAYNNRRWNEAIANASRAAVHDPRYLMKKGWWSATLKSLVRFQSGARCK